MQPPGLVGADSQPRAGRRGLGGEQDIEVGVGELAERGQKGLEALGWRRAGSEGRLAPQHRILQVPFTVSDHRSEQVGLVAEAAVHGPDTDSGGAGDLAHVHGTHSPLGEQPDGGVEDSALVAVRELALRAPPALHGQRPGLRRFLDRDGRLEPPGVVHRHRP